ncbi:MAG: O-antigen ligase family protein, partial [Armatimonadetes bacterium]|nr:O-antigen ligase family protein [Armatimonadota bacterium]
SRVAGTLGDANAFGIYLGMMLPLLTSLRIAWAAIPLFIGATVVSFSRTGLVSVSASLMLSLANLGLRRYLLVVLACAIVFVGVWGVASSTTVGKRVANYQDTLETRQGLWTLAAEVTMQHPLLGIGKGNWNAVTGRKTLPHNTFLSVMVDGGLFGFAIFLVPLTVWLWRGARSPRARPWAIAVFIGLVGGLAVSLDNFRPFWVAVGVLVAVLLGSPAGARQVRSSMTPSLD